MSLSEDQGFSLDDSEPEEPGLSLEELGKAYADLMKGGEVPFQEPEEVPEQVTEPQLYDPLEEELDESDDCPITPDSIVEAALFLGHPENQPLTAESLASLMRGVRPAEVEQIIGELNELYRRENFAFEIVSVGGGFRLEIARDLLPLRDRFYGKVKETKLNQAAIDVLALVGYQPGIERKMLEKQWGKPAGGVLSQLVRRNLLEIRREGKGKGRKELYYPTQRFLDLFQIERLDDLPIVHDDEDGIPS